MTPLMGRAWKKRNAGQLCFSMPSFGTRELQKVDVLAHLTEKSVFFASSPRHEASYCSHRWRCSHGAFWGRDELKSHVL